MATAAAPIPVPTEDPRSLVQSILAIKQDIETGHGIMDIVNRSRPVTKTDVNVSIGAAISAVKATL